MGQNALQKTGTVAGLLALSSGGLAQTAETYKGRIAWSIGNPAMKVIVTPGGGHIASMTLKSGRGAGLNPLWLPPWKSVEPGNWNSGVYGDKPAAQLLCCILGHNICLDFFGAPSSAETAAGIPVHGEAPCVNWKADRAGRSFITYSADLPLAQMRVTRSMKLAPKASAVWIEETVTNLAPFDRPFGWTQHVTLSPPFLEQGATFYDFSGGWSTVYPKEFSKQETLKRGAEFEWPDAPGKDGGSVDLRRYPRGTKNSDFTVSLARTESKWAYFTAINVKKGLLVGYIWPRNEWPWIANWEESHARTAKPWLGKAVARGTEFGTTPYPDSRRDMVTLNKLHGTPTYRWISAKGKQTVGYAAFLSSIPVGATGVKNVKMEGKVIRIELEGVDKTVTLPLAK